MGRNSTCTSIVAGVSSCWFLSEMGKPPGVYLSLTTQADPPAAPQAGFHKNERPATGRTIRVKEQQMRKLFYFTSILLITAGMTFAQAGGSSTGSTTGAGSASGSSTGAAPGSDQGAAPSSSTPSDQTGSSATSTGTSSSDQTTISGCVSKS